MITAVRPEFGGLLAVEPTASERSTLVKNDSVGSQMLYRYLCYTPALWIVGLLAPVGALILLRLFAGKVSIMRVGFVVSAWWAVGLMQAICVFVNWAAGGLSASELAYRLASAPVTGWFALGTALAVGKAHRLKSSQVVRGVCILGLHLLIFGALSMVFALFTGAEKLDLRSPIALVLPGDLPSISTLFTAHFYILEDTFGSELPRLILFYPWSVCLGFAGIAVLFISLQENDTFWRSTGVLGGLLAVAGSMSRAAVAALLVAGALYVWRRWSRCGQFIGVLLACAVVVLLLLCDLSIFTAGSKSVTEMRAGSSEARQLGYDEAWLGFLRSPIFGHGWPGEPLGDNIPMFVGSHSTVYGLLYTGGALTFGTFIIAIGCTVAKAFRASVSGTGPQRACLSIIVALAILCYGEGIYSFAIPTLFVFCWIGAAFNGEV
jgi:O-Antigen ligase